MGALATIIAAISEDVVAALADASYPPLTPDASGNAGAILVGSASTFEQTSPPRIIFEPIGSKFSAADWSSASSTLSTIERKAQNAMRTIAREDFAFNVRCWGASTTGVAVDDYDVTRALYHQIRASLQKLMPGCFSIEESGKFTDSSHAVRSGREYIFGVTFFTPVLDALIPYAVPNRTAAEIAAVVATFRAPSDVAADGTDHMITPDGVGSTEPGCS